MNPRLSLFLIVCSMLVLSAVPANACPLVGGFIDYNCDGVHRVFVTGDSIVRGVGDADMNRSTGGYVLDLSERYPESEFVNFGIPGITAQRLMRKIKQGLRRGRTKFVNRIQRADVFIIEVGTNDYWPRTSGAAIVRNLKRIMKSVSKYYEETLGTVPPLFAIATLPPTLRGFQNPYIAYVNQTLLRAKSADFPVQVRFDRLKGSIISGDLLHPDANGYEAMARKVSRFLERRAQRRAALVRTDEDGDGIYDQLEALLFSTDPLLPDTDGDGLLDGAEVFTHGTSPILADTDGDSVNDGDEVGAGTDPNDPNHF